MMIKKHQSDERRENKYRRRKISQAKLSNDIIPVAFLSMNTRNTNM